MDQEKVWLQRVGKELNEFLSAHGYRTRSERTMFCLYHGISDRQFRALRTGEYFLPTEIYAILNWVCGVEAADPTKIPPRIKHLPTGGVKRIERAWTDHMYLIWIGKQNDSHLITAMVQEMEFGEHAPLVAELEPSLYALERLLWRVIDTKDEELWDKLAAQFGSVIPNLFALLSALTLTGGQRAIAIAMLLTERSHE